MELELDDELADLRGEVGAHVADLQSRALAIDAAPADLAAHLEADSVRAIFRLGMIDERPRAGRCLRSAVGAAEAARGDAGVLLACPGPSVAGAVVELIADDEQRSRFRTVLADGRNWAFCAITEPQAGSDMLRMRSELRPAGDGGHLLTGVKRYVGNASRAGTGVVFARTGPSPMSIRAALVHAPAPGLSSSPLPMQGLRGARIGELRFDDVYVPAEDLLGRHLSRTRSGVWAAVRAFDTVRVQVAAMALGTVHAVHEYVRRERGRCRRWEQVELDGVAGRAAALRQLVYRAAVDVDAGRGRGHGASLAKLEAVALVRSVTRTLPRLLGAGALLEHPLLEKWRRDATGFEFMEGTSSMQRLNVAEGYLRHSGEGPAS